MQTQEENGKELEKNKSSFEKEDVKKDEKDVQEKKVKKQNAEERIKQQEQEYKEKNKKKRKKIKIIVITIIIALIILLFSMIFAILNLGNDKIISGISINGIEVSGLTQEEAKGKIQAMFTEKSKKEINLKYKDYEIALNPELIEVKYNLDTIIEDVYNIGRKGNIFENNYEILLTTLNKKNLDVVSTFNKEQLDKILDDNSSKLPDAIKESSYYVEDDELIITRGTKGVVIDKENTENKIRELLDNIENNQNFIEVNVIEKEPKPIDIDAIYQEVHKEAKDAYYTKEPFEVFPEVNGVDFDIEQAKEMLKEDKEEYTIKLTITKPKVTIDQIGTAAFPDQLATFTTRYNAGDVNRTTNLRIACQKINDKVLLAGETFSYNKTLGARTIAAGYKEAKIYSAGQVVDGLGGGICQISSTLYNAVVMANLQIVERRNHQFVTSYLPAGRDATVVYGATDFQFKNTRKYPIRIRASVQNGIATVSLYGLKEEEEYQITFDTRTVGTTPFSTQYIDDSSLEPGKEVVTQKGANGLQTETYITKSLNGKVVSRTLLSKDTYTPMQRIVRKSTSSGGTAETKQQVSAPVENNNEKTQNVQQQTKTENTETPKTENNEQSKTPVTENKENKTTITPTQTNSNNANQTNTQNTNTTTEKKDNTTAKN